MFQILVSAAAILGTDVLGSSQTLFVAQTHTLTTFLKEIHISLPCKRYRDIFFLCDDEDLPVGLTCYAVSSSLPREENNSN